MLVRSQITSGLSILTMIVREVHHLPEDIIMNEWKFLDTNQYSLGEPNKVAEQSFFGKI